MKVCTRCGGEPKPFSEFHKDASKSDGLRPDCKACAKVSTDRWRAANPTRLKASAAKYHAANRKSIRARNAAWRAANPEKLKNYRVANPEIFSAANCKWRVANRELISARKAANPEVARIDAHNRRAKKRANGGVLSKGLTEKLFKLQRGKCACCRVSLKTTKSHMDHVIPVALDGPNVDSNMQLLCWLCNQQKHAKHPIQFMQQKGYLL